MDYKGLHFNSDSKEKKDIKHVAHYDLELS
jgi:hypothetical protein